MHEFRVWAPRPSSVALVLGGGARPLPMTAAADGWWTLAVEDATPGTRYACSLDGGAPVPDPRALRLPDGVHGAAELVDLDAIEWTDAGWSAPALADGVVYELHVGTFTPEGTLDAAIERLPHLVSLGITHVELMPVNAFPGRWGWGYDGVGLYAVHEPYGGPLALARFVDAAHAHGLAVVLDVVYNHLGPSGNYLGDFGPYFTDRYGTPWGQALNTDGPGSDEVRAFVVDNALHWLRDFHVDALRLDAVHAIVDTSATHLLEELQAAVEALERTDGRRHELIAESDLNDPRVVTPTARGGYGLAAQWSDDFHHALHSALTGERDGYYADFGGLGPVATALTQVFVYAGQHSPYRARRHGRPVRDLPATRFVGYLQTHDQVGNRAAGERTSHLLSDGCLAIGAALVLLSPFVPMLLMGEEWAATSPFQYFTDHDDPDLAEAVRTGRRSEFAAFGWAPEDVPDPQDAGTVERSRLGWDEVTQPRHARMLAWHRALIALRREQPELRDGDLAATAVTVDDDAQWLRLDRHSWTVLANLSGAAVTLPVTPDADVVLAFDEVARAGDAITLAAESVVVLHHPSAAR